MPYITGLPSASIAIMALLYCSWVRIVILLMTKSPVIPSVLVLSVGFKLYINRESSPDRECEHQVQKHFATDLIS